jgi:hypothetical protein
MNSGNDSPLHLAIARGKPGLVQKLLEAGVSADSCDAFGWSALGLAARCGEEDCVKILLAARADPNSKILFGLGYPCKITTALHAAASLNKSACMTLLFKAGADIEAVDGNGHTPIWHAVSRIRPQPLELLLDRGASIPKILTPDQMPGWLKTFLNKRKHCQSAVIALYGVLRKRYRPANNRIPKDMVRMLAVYTRHTRYNKAWDLQLE